VVILRPKSLNQSCRFWGPNRETVDLDFEAQPRNPTLFLRLNQETHTPRLHVHGVDRTSPDLLIARPSSTWHVLDYTWSSASGLLLLLWSSLLPAMLHLPPIHHETSKHDSLHKSKDKGKTSKMYWIRIQTSAYQWLITSNKGTDHLISHFMSSPPSSTDLHTTSQATLQWPPKATLLSV
jgi:hypothetical protein